MSSVTPDALRAAVLATVGPHTDPRVVKIANDGVLTVDHAVSEWEASSGHVVAHRVRVGLPAALLGMVRGHPHVEDEITRIMSVAMATSIGDRVSEVVFHHDPAAGPAPSVETAYRGSLPPSERPPVSLDDLSRLAADWLSGFGDQDAAAAVREAAVLRPEHATLLERCLEDLTSAKGSRSGRGP